MTSRRTAKAAEAIRETVSTTILFGLKDPRVRDVTVLSVDVAPDLTRAKVHVSVMGDVKRQALSMHGLNAARGYLQAKLAERLQTRNTPVLTFVLDVGVKRSIEAFRLLRETGVPLSESENPELSEAEAADEVDGILSDEDHVEADADVDAEGSEGEFTDAGFPIADFPIADSAEESDAHKSPVEPA